MTFRLANAEPGSTGWLVVGTSTLQVPLLGGVLGPAPDLLVGPLPLSEATTLAVMASWPDGAPDVWLQFWLQDAATQGGFAATSTVMASSP